MQLPFNFVILCPTSNASHESSCASQSPRPSPERLLKQVRVDESRGWRTRLNISALRTKRRKVLSHARTKLGDVTTAVKTSVVKLSRSARNDSQSMVR